MSRVIKREKHTIERMIRLYCRHRLHQQQPNEEYTALTAYCIRRLDLCKWGEQKPPCKLCPSHCYAPEQREKVRQIMKWMGPRMIFYAPMEVVRHLLGKG